MASQCLSLSHECRGLVGIINTPLSELRHCVEELESKVSGHLDGMGFAL